MSDLDEKSDTTQKQVRHHPLLLVVLSHILFGIEVAMIVLHQTAVVFIPILLFVFVLLAYINEKLIYDDTGIILCNPFGRRFPISWGQVLSVEYALNNPCRTRGMSDRVLMITYTTSNGKTETIRLGYSIKSLGMSEFLAYDMTKAK